MNKLSTILGMLGLIVLMGIGNVKTSVAQNFSITSENTIWLWTNNPERSLEGKISVKNNLNAKSKITWYMTENTMKNVTDWDISFCDPCQCFIDYPNADSNCIFEPLEEKYFSVHVTTNKKIGIGKMTIVLKAVNEDDTKLQSLTFNVKHSTTSIEETLNGTSFRITPNPVADVMQIQIPQNGYTFESAEILDLTGKVLLHQNINSVESKLNVDVSNLPQGLYLVRLVTKDKVAFHQKIIKK